MPERMKDRAHVADDLLDMHYRRDAVAAVLDDSSDLLDPDAQFGEVCGEAGLG